MQPVATSLTSNDIEHFKRDGFVVVKGAFAREDAEAMQDAWWRELYELYDIRRDDPRTWQQQPRDLRGGKSSPMQRRMNTARVRGVIDDLLGADTWRWPRHWGRAIVTFPQGGTWDVPGCRDRQGLLWHWDSPVQWHREGLNGVFVFSFVGAVDPGGGGTSILAGSHHLLRLWDRKMSQPLGKDAAAQRLWFNRAHPWLTALTGGTPPEVKRRAMFMEDGVEIEGIGLRVVELNGEPGDMVFCHPVIVHSVSPNCGSWPRMMRIGSVLTKQLLMTRKGERP